MLSMPVSGGGAVLLLPALLDISQDVPFQEKGAFAEGLLSLLGLICLEVNVKLHFPFAMKQGRDESPDKFPDSSAQQSKDVPRGGHILASQGEASLHAKAPGWVW